jgi:hypothetical protein
MHIVILTAGQGGSLSTQHLRHGHNPRPESDLVNLLVLDSRHMSPECFAAATRTVNEIRARFGLRHGVLLCGQKPQLQIIVGAIRCGLRDVITQYMGAAHLRQLLRASVPALSRRDFREAIAFLRTFGGLAGADTEAENRLGRRAEELKRLSESIAEREKALVAEKDRLTKLDQDLRERTRRLDRQIARMQTDADVAPAGSVTPFAGSSSGGANALPAELAALSARLEKRSAELDVREKLLNEMQALLLAAPKATATAKPGPASPSGGRPLAGAGM